MSKYGGEEWLKRMSNRTDIGGYLTHLTKGNNEMDAVEVLIKILNEKTIKASDGFTIDKEKVVCFQDAPLYGIVQNLIYEEAHFKGRKRYEGTGLMLAKPYMFNKGCRPVIYETRENSNELFSNVKWRIVTTDYKKEKVVDWSHEREWRFKGNLEFELDKVCVILNNSKDYAFFISNVDKEILSKIQGIITLQHIQV